MSIGAGDDSPVVLLEGDEAHTAPRFTADQVREMLDVRQREARSWLSAPSSSPGHDDGAPARAHGAARYSLNDVQLLESAKRLRRDDIPSRRIRAAFASLKRRLPAGNSPLALRLQAEGRRVLVHDGDGTWDAESGQFLIEFAGVSEEVELPAAERGGGLQNSRRIAELAPANVLRFEDRRQATWGARQWYERARELELGDEPGVRHAYSRALERDPQMVDAHIDFGRYLHETGDLDGARHHYQTALEVDGGSSTAVFNLGVVLEDLGELGRAVEAYERTLDLEPGYPDALYNLARLHEIRGDRTAALRCLQGYRRALRS